MSGVSTRDLIEAAFADVPYPDNDPIADHQDCRECDEIRAFFRGKSWREMQLSELHGFQAALSLFTPQALRYFLPGYMLASLGHWEEADMIPSSILYHWLPTNADEKEVVKHYRGDRQAIFSQAERIAIAAYLTDYQDYDDPCRGDDDIPTALAIVLNREAFD